MGFSCGKNGWQLRKKERAVGCNGGVGDEVDVVAVEVCCGGLLCRGC